MGGTRDPMETPETPSSSQFSLVLPESPYANVTNYRNNP